MAYTYIERTYGKRFEAGDRANGVVRGVRDDPQYVRVLFDDGHEGDCHPGSVEVVSEKEGMTPAMEEDDIVERLRYHTATLDRPLCMEAASEIERLRSALAEISKGEGIFSRDPLTFATNTIESMKQVALDALKG